jgi:sortase A
MKNIEQPEVSVTGDTSRKCENCWIGRSLLRTIQIGLLIIGLVFVGIFGVARMESYFASRAALDKFEAAERAVAADETQTEAEIAAGEPDFRDWGEGRVRAYQESTKQQNGVPLAVLQIPSLSLKAPVFNGTDDLTLNHAVGRIEGTAMPGERGNIGLAAHRDGFFRGLKDIKPGDAIELKTHGATDIYTVDRIQIVGPNDVSVLRAQDKPAVTLVTCYPFYFVGSAPKRFVVTAYLAQDSSAGSTTTEARLNTQPNNPALEEQ